MTALRLALLLFLLPSLAWSADGVEAYCQTLRDDADANTTCDCSEPLDFTEAQITWIVGPNNPPDTTNSTFSCNGGNAITHQSGNISTSMVTSISAGLTQGTDPPTSVLKWKQGPQCGGGSDPCTAGSINDVSPGINTTDCTWCERVYIRYSDGIVPPGGQQDIKGMQEESTSGEPEPNILMEPVSGNFQLTRPGPADQTGNGWDWGAGSATVTQTGDLISLNDCSNQGWCETQLCFDHNWDATDHFQVRARVRALGGAAAGQQANWSRQYSNTGPAASTATKLRRYMRATIDNQTAHRFISHVMSAVICPADPNYFILPAVEIEGTAPPSPPTPPMTNGIGAPGGGITLSMLSRKLLPFYYAYMPGVH